MREGIYNKRYIARVVLETQSAISIKSGDKGILRDSAVAIDWNGLPIIPGTSIVGCLRREFYSRLIKSISEEEMMEKLKNYFGGDLKQQQEGEEKQINLGSRVMVSDGLFCGSQNNVYQDLNLEFSNKDHKFLNKAKFRAIRDHVRINNQGVSETNEHAKFDEEIVWKGSRFKFEIEFISDGSDVDKSHWEYILQIFSIGFYIGSGSKTGLGKVAAKTIESSVLDLDNEDDRKAYLMLTSDLNPKIPNATKYLEKNQTPNNAWLTYTIRIRPESFFIFGSDKGSDKSDHTTKKEEVVKWEKSEPKFESKYLIPGTSIKGALAHRAVYHFNTKNNLTIERIVDEFILENTTINKEQIDNTIRSKYIGQALEIYGNENHPCKVELFGNAKEDEKEIGKAGSVIVEDIHFPIEWAYPPKVFDHVKIDQFTAGAIEGALFNEEVLMLKEKKSLILVIQLIKYVEDKYREALEAAIEDLTSGRLALGGLTTKGHGSFKEFNEKQTT